ncbi:post-GPI attachment to proteins factor 4-like [Mya arenaria]|uniref:post-GPI attachment to proteins factor 4-like n=1 Tax=Mya arenaria TaxID=6604 RepID=UPI0022E51641|nr:post-GPI attachment to proteins factor 4-like [Mya arenaria]
MSSGICKIKFSVVYRTCMCSLKGCQKGQCLLLLFLTIFILVTVPTISWDIPLSRLYGKFHSDDSAMDQAQVLNEQRYQKAFRYFSGLDSRSSRLFYEGKEKAHPDIVIAIITTQRKKMSTHYLVQTVAVMDHILKSDTLFANTFLFICNVDQSPQNHEDAVLLQEYIPYVQMMGNNSFNQSFQPYTYISENNDYKRGQETKDYLFCLNVSKQFNSEFVFILEDDVIPYTNILEVLHYVLRKHHFLHSSHSESNPLMKREFSYLKLYYPERWQGFANEVDRILELVCYGLVGGAIVLGIFSAIFSHKFNFTYKTKMLYYTIGCALTIYTVILLDRQQVMEFRRISPQLFRMSPSPACCTPAMLYSSHIIPGLISHLIDISQMNKDLAIYDFIEKQQIPGYLLEPNLVRHIGLYTSLQNLHKPPKEFLFTINLP